MRFEEIKNSPCSQLKESTDSNPRRGRLSGDIKLAFFQEKLQFCLNPALLFHFFEEKYRKSGGNGG